MNDAGQYDGSQVDGAVSDGPNDAPPGDAPITGDAGSPGTIVLNTLKAFPSAFGAGQLTSGGRGGAIYEVTNLNDSGAGSYRDAVSKGNRIIIIKVEGLAKINSALTPSTDDLTIWGQFAPGRGLTVSGDRIVQENASNIVMRQMTFQNKTATGYSAFGFRDLEPGGGIYADHNSFRYGMDQTFDVISRHTDNRVTMAYNLMAEGLEGHNTGSIVGDSGSGAADTGRVTFARNMYYNISHRFPNLSGNPLLAEVYNNYIVNWSARLTNCSGGVKVDWFHNHAEKGNRPQSSNTPVNKASYNAGFKTYTGWNFVGGVDETPFDNQTGLWVNYKANVEGADNAPINATHYVKTRQHDFGAPEDGVWNVATVPSKVRASVGHNRGIKADGSPGVFRDDKDADYVAKAASGKSESSYRLSSAWDDSKFTGTALYADTDGDHMPDWFENLHPHLNPNVADGDAKQVDWDFGDYKVTNNAGYTNLEICAEFYAGGFESMLDGTNDMKSDP